MMLRKGLHSAYLGLAIARFISGVHRGRTGLRFRSKLACCGVRPPLRRLQSTQLATTFSQIVFPPSARGTTWSRFRCERGGRSPQ